MLSATKRTKRMRSSTRRKMRGGTVINYLTSYPAGEVLDDDVANFYIKKTDGSFIFSKVSAEEFQGLTVLKARISYEEFLKLAKNEDKNKKDIAKLYNISPDGDMELNENIVDNMQIPKKTGVTYKTYVFVNDQGKVEWIVIDTNNTDLDYRNYPDTDLTKLIKGVEEIQDNPLSFRAMAQPTYKKPGYVLATGTETTYPFPDEGGSKRISISKHRRTKRRTRGGGRSQHQMKNYN
jgi:hypothetical protein